MTAALAREGIAPDSSLPPLAPIGKREPEKTVSDKLRLLAAAPAVPPVL
jgi:hypothetical protein